MALVLKPHIEAMSVMVWFAHSFLLVWLSWKVISVKYECCMCGRNAIQRLCACNYQINILNLGSRLHRQSFQSGTSKSILKLSDTRKNSKNSLNSEVFLLLSSNLVQPNSTHIILLWVLAFAYALNNCGNCGKVEMEWVIETLTTVYTFRLSQNKNWSVTITTYSN